MYFLAYMGKLIGVFLFLYERIRKLFFLFFVQIWQKMWYLVTLAPPEHPPFTQNLVFVDRVERTFGDTYWDFFYHYMLQLENLFFVFF